MANIRKSFNFRNGLQIDNDNFVVNAAGLVGIGTTRPEQYLLNVYGGTRVTGLTTSGELYTGIGTVGVLSATSANVTGALSVGSLNVAGTGAVTNLVGYAYTAWITNDGGVGLHTVSRIGIATDSTPPEELRVTGDARVTGILTATTFSGSLPVTDLTGTLTNAQLPTNIDKPTGIITASSFVGTATTASSLSGTPDINVSVVTATKLIADEIQVPNTGITTVTKLLHVGTGGTVFSALEAGRVGVGTAIPTSDLQIRKSSGTLAEVVSDSGQARISVGNSVGAGNSSATLRFGNSAGVLDIINNDVGDVKTIIHAGTGAGSTGNFKWIYGQTSSERMTLTYDGKLGINQSTPVNTLHVVGTSTVTGNAWVGGNLNVAGSITGSITLDPVLTNTNLNNTSGITTLAQLDVTSSVDFGTTTLVSMGNTVAIGTDTGSDEYSLVVEQGLRADRIEVQGTGGINANAGIITASRIEVSSGYSMQGFTTAVQLYYDGTGVVLNVVGIGSITLTLI